jgi:hypothetical protein
MTGWLLLGTLFSGITVTIWLIQELAVRWIGDGRRGALPLRHESDSPWVRGSVKAALITGLVVTVLAYPAARGHHPITYHLERFRSHDVSPAFRAALAALGALTSAYLIALALGWIRLDRHRASLSRLTRKLVKAILTPLPLVLLEEPLFRGVVLEELIHNGKSVRLAIVLGAIIFAAAHFVRPQKHAGVAFVGLCYVGLLLGTAYIISGRGYLLPCAIHAAGVFFIQTTRPISVYLGPAWLIGRSSYPVGGLTSIATLTVAAIYVF